MGAAWREEKMEGEREGGKERARRVKGESGSNKEG